MSDPITAFGHFVLAVFRRAEPAPIPAALAPASIIDAQIEELRRELERTIDADTKPRRRPDGRWRHG